MPSLIHSRMHHLIIINLVLSILFVLSLLVLMRDALSPGFSPSIKPSERQESARQQHDGLKAYKTLSDLEPIFKNNPFGFPAGDFKPITVSGDSLSIEMRLIGTVSGGLDYAIFIDKDGKQEIFRSGERLFNSGTLERVYKDKVVVFERGRRIEIPLSDIITIETGKPRESIIPSIVKSSGNNSFIISQEGIRNALENPSQLMTDARLQPNYVNGSQKGFLLREVKNGGIYQSLGLQNGDVILRINNYDITDPEVALRALTALKGMNRVDLDIIRNGVRMTLNYQIR